MNMYETTRIMPTAATEVAPPRKLTTNDQTQIDRLFFCQRQLKKCDKISQHKQKLTDCSQEFKNISKKMFTFRLNKQFNRRMHLKKETHGRKRCSYQQSSVEADRSGLKTKLLPGFSVILRSKVDNR